MISGDVCFMVFLVQKYFAFISYNRKNLAAAEFIQNALEHYRYPRESIAENLWPDDQVYVRKIFLDKSHLSGRGEKFEAQLIDALSKSKYLIVVCSPETAETKRDSSKHYVNWEIETFLKIHGKDALSRIIPVIYKGEPDLSDSSCLPLPIRIAAIAQRNLPDMRPAGKQKEYFWNRKQHWFQAIITLLTYTFDVERSIIFDRFEAERAKQRTKIIISSAVILIFLILLTTWFVLERNRAWVETEKNKAQLQISENQKQDAVARISFNEALKIIQNDGTNANRPLALLHLANSWRLPEARRRASLFLQQNSWLVPIESAAGKEMPPANFTLPSLDAEIVIPQNIPQDYPLTFSVKNGILQTTLTSSNKLLWEKTNQWGIHSLNISPDGRFMMLLKVLPSFSVEAYDPFTGNFMWRKELENLPVTSAFSPDGMRFAVLQQNKSVKIFRNDNGTEEFEYCKFPVDTWKIEFTDDSSNIWASSPKQSVKYTLLSQTMDIPVLCNWEHPVSAYCVSPSKKLLILAGQTAKTAEHSSILFCRADTLKKIGSIDVNGYTHTMAVSNDEKLLAAIHDKTLAIYDISDSINIKEIFKHRFSYRPDNLLFDREAKKCYIAGDSITAWCWDRKLNSCTPTTFVDTAVIQSMAWGNQGELITCGKDLLFWNIDNGKKLRSLSLRGSYEKFTISNQYIIFASRLLRQVAVYNLNGEKLWQTTPYSEPGVIPFAVSKDSNLIAVAESRNSVRVFELATGEPVTEKIITDKKINSVKFCNNSSDNTQYLFIGGGNMQQGFYIVYDVNARDAVYHTETGNSSIDCFLELGNDLVFISGTSNSKHSVFGLPEIKQFGPAVFRTFFENYTGASINKNGVTKEKTAAILDSRQTETIFPAAMFNASQRMIKKGVLINDIASEMSERDYQLAAEALYLSPNNLAAMKNFWMRTARMLAVKNQCLFQLGKTGLQLETERATYTAEDWATFIFSDPQALYFADYFTKQMIKLHPDDKVAQNARNNFLRITGNLSADKKTLDLEKIRIKETWEKLVYEPGETNIAQIHAVALYQLRQNCNNIDSVKKYLDEMALLLIRNSDITSLNSYHTIMICDLISKIYTVCRYAPDGSAATVDFLQKIIGSIENHAKPEGIANQLLFDLNATLSEIYFCTGNLNAGQEALLKANNYSSESFTAVYVLPYLQVLRYIVSGQTKNAFLQWNDFINKRLKDQVELASALSKQLWESLETMKYHGLNLGEMEKIRLQYAKRFNTGIPIKVIPGRTAAKMGWQNNDKIIEFAGYPVTSSEDLSGILFALDISPTTPQKVTVKLKQKNGIHTYEVRTKQKLGFMF